MSIREQVDGQVHESFRGIERVKWRAAYSDLLEQLEESVVDVSSAGRNISAWALARSKRVNGITLQDAVFLREQTQTSASGPRVGRIAPR